MHRPIIAITYSVIDYIFVIAGIDRWLVANALIEAHPNGVISGFMTEYFEIAFKGTKEAIQFEEVTTRLSLIIKLIVDIRSQESIIIK